MDIEPVFCDCEGVGESGWESDEDLTSIESNDESNPQRATEFPPDSPHRSGVPWDSSPMSPCTGLSPSAKNPPQPKKNMKAVSNIRNEFRHCLENIHDGRFATSGALPNAVNPGIFVPHLGVVGLPMSDRDAEAIINIVKEDRNQADRPRPIVSPPAGSFELIPGQFEIQNPAWRHTLTEAVAMTAKALKLNSQIESVKAEMARLSICRPDDPVHDQQQKNASARFVTLMISLPSEHTGGNIAVGFEGKKKVLRTAAGSKFGFSYLSWYTDADVDRHSVKTGYRLMLVYDILFSEPGITLSAARMNDAQQNLKDVFGKWEQEITSHPELAPKQLLYLLERPLSKSCLRLDFLRGEDHLKAYHLMTACQAGGFCFFLATMEYSVTRYLDEDEDDEDHCPCCLQHAKNKYAWDGHEERSCNLSAIIVADGRYIAGGIEIDQLNVIQDQVIGPNLEPDEYDSAERINGGVGLSDTGLNSDTYQRGLVHTYYRNCVVVVPRTSRFDFLLNGKGPNELRFDVWTDTLLQELENESLSVASKGELKELCRRIVEGSSTMSEIQLKTFSMVLERVVIAALRVNDPDLFRNTLCYPAAEMLPFTVFGKNGRSVAELDLNIWQQSLKAVLFSISTLSGRYNALDKLMAGFESSTPDNDIAKHKLTDFTGQMLSIFNGPEASCRILTRHDMGPMTRLVRRFGEQSFLPLLKVNLSQSGLIVALLGELYRTLKSQPKELQSAFRTVLQIFIPSFQIPQHLPLSKRRRTKNQTSGDVRSSAFLPDLFTAEELATQIGHCEKLRLDTEIESLLRIIRIRYTAGNIDMSVYESFLMPLLTYLLPIFPRRHVQLNTGRYQKFYQTICIAYTQQHVGPKPTPPPNWTRAPKGCHLSFPSVTCDDCTMLDTFLIRPEENVIRFATELKYRHHIKDQLTDQIKKRFLKVVTTMTDRSKPLVRNRGTISEYMLVITKTVEEWRQDLSRWKVRRAEANRKINAIGSDEVLRMLLSGENGLVTELGDLELFEPSQLPGEPGSKPLTLGNKRPRASEGFSKIHLLD